MPVLKHLAQGRNTDDAQSTSSSCSLSLSSLTFEDEAWVREALGQQLFTLHLVRHSLPLRVEVQPCSRP